MSLLTLLFVTALVGFLVRALACGCTLPAFVLGGYKVAAVTGVLTWALLSSVL